MVVEVFDTLSTERQSLCPFWDAGQHSDTLANSTWKKWFHLNSLAKTTLLLSPHLPLSLPRPSLCLSLLCPPHNGAQPPGGEAAQGMLRTGCLPCCVSEPPGTESSASQLPQLELCGALCVPSKLCSNCRLGSKAMITVFCHWFVGIFL